MSIATLDPTQQAVINGINLPQAERTKWNVPLISDDSFHRITSLPPNGFSLQLFGRPCIEWLDTQTGGVAVVFDNNDSNESFSNVDHLPSQIYEGPSWSYLIPGEAPGTKSYYISKLFGYQVIVRTPDAIVVQIPGAEDYATGYRFLNDGQDPFIVPVESDIGLIKGHKFVNMIAKGKWPFDMHFFKDHIALAVGGPELEQDVINIAAELGSRMDETAKLDLDVEVYDEEASELDLHAGFAKHYFPAKNRINGFLATGGDVRELCKTKIGDNPEVVKRFNALAASDKGINLPDYDITLQPGRLGRITNALFF